MRPGAEPVHTSRGCSKGRSICPDTKTPPGQQNRSRRGSAEMTRVSKVLRDLADQMLKLKNKQSHRGKQAWPGRNPESAFSLRTDPTLNTQPGQSSQQPAGRCSHGRVTGQPPEPQGRYAVWPRRHRKRQPARGPGCDDSSSLARGDGPGVCTPALFRSGQFRPELTLVFQQIKGRLEGRPQDPPPPVFPQWAARHLASPDRADGVQGGWRMNQRPNFLENTLLFGGSGKIPQNQ